MTTFPLESSGEANTPLSHPKVLLQTYIYAHRSFTMIIRAGGRSAQAGSKWCSVPL
jgi:hypothetical protein